MSARLIAVFVMCSVLLVHSDLRASQLMLGLVDHDVFIQEYWSDGRPYYAIANWTDNPVRVGIRKYSYRSDGARFYDEKYGPVVREWHVAARAVDFVQVTGVDTMQYVNVVLNDKSSGLLLSMKSIAPRSGRKDVVVTNSCMNYWRGSADGTLFLEQPSMAFKGGRKMRLALFVAKGVEDIAFGPYSELMGFLNPGSVVDMKQYELPLPLVWPTKVKCSTLKVEREGKLFTFDTNRDSGGEFHEVTLDFELPKVSVSTPMLISGCRREGPGSGAWITRMIIVEP